MCVYVAYLGAPMRLRRIRTRGGAIGLRPIRAAIFAHAVDTASILRPHPCHVRPDGYPQPSEKSMDYTRDMESALAECTRARA